MLIDLFSLYVLFSHFTPRDATPGNGLMHVQMYAELMKKQKENSHEDITWTEMGQQNVQAKKVHCKRPYRSEANILSYL